MTKESALVQYMMQLLRAEGFYVEKNHGSPFSTVGRPDLEGCARGHFFAIEAKTPTGVLSAAQMYQLQEIRHAGGITWVVRSKEEVKLALEILCALKTP